MSAAAREEGGAPGAAAFPWDQAMGLAFGVLGVRPADFWAMTPRELGHTLAPLGAHVVAPPSRGALDDLMSRFPDRR